MFEPKRWTTRGIGAFDRVRERFVYWLLRPGEVTTPPELADAELVRIPLYRLRIDNPVRISGENSRYVDALAEVYAALPPVVVHRPSMTVIDGAHRVRAAQSAGGQWIDALYFDGDDAQAFLLAVRLNSGPGLPLSAAERKAAAARALSYFPDWSNRTLAEEVGLSERAVASIRKRSAAAPVRARSERRPASMPTRTADDGFVPA
ncbi:ParB/RepB/Spo0J family partition protein [Nocardia sp. CDC153]|uniref:ParB/RepB/Spo0J family partition protein n=1 Tax=Nocardia sp. CDC153 TaxID=3112167 RepID=UPI002DB6B2D6|nr:ParB/RepB/Spo0J family partition protein [Nocardia sp. CDC153]MEC3952781.1 ParB/RepB/Spo0J family partition protein [Nocardia sp. CDC153]